MTRATLKQIAGFLFDLDSVMYIGNRSIDGAALAIKHLKGKNIPCRFTTNTTVLSNESLHRKRRTVPSFPMTAKTRSSS